MKLDDKDRREGQREPPPPPPPPPPGRLKHVGHLLIQA